MEALMNIAPNLDRWGNRLLAAMPRETLATRAIIQIPGIFNTISAVDFRRAASNNGLIRDLVSRYTEVLLAETQQTAACNAIHDASQRLCRWLLLGGLHRKRSLAAHA